MTRERLTEILIHLPIAGLLMERVINEVMKEQEKEKRNESKTKSVS